MITLKETHVLVAIDDVDFVNGLADKFRRSGDQEERNIGLIAEAVLERLGIKKSSPEAATSREEYKKLRNFIINHRSGYFNG